MEKFLSIFKQEELTETMKKFASKQLEESMWIADGFELSASSINDLKYMILDEEKCKQYQDTFLIFGQATHSGSSYAFYKTPGSKNCDEWPVVVMGDEGGCVALAENIFGLMRFLTLNSVQPYVDSSDYQNFNLFADDDLEPSNQEYIDWIKKEFGLEALLSIEQAQEEIINPTIERYQHILDPIFEV